MDLSSQPDQPTAMTIADIGAAFRAGTLSPVTLTQACLDRIARYDNTLHSFITVTADRALAAARKAEAELKAGQDRGPFHGIPYALKDIVDAEGVPTTAHSRLMPETPATADAHVTALLETAGGILLGKLGTFEFALATAVEPLEHRLPARRVVLGIGRCRVRRVRAGRDRDRHRRLGPLARRLLWHRRSEAHLWPDQPAGRAAQHLLHRPLRPDDPHRP